VGLITAEQLDAIHERMQQLIEKGAGQRLDAIYYSPDDRNSNSMTRKPAPGMLLQAAEDHGLDLERSWMIGDSVKDIGAALSAGVRPILIENPASSETRGFLSPDVQEKTVIVATISEAVSIILSGSKQNKRFF
jgi:histidinol phosphatase-like enzyme